MSTRQTLHIAGSGVIGGAAGFLTRPCCVIPASLSLLGFSGAGLGQFVIEYRPVLVSTSVVLLGASMFVTFRTVGAWPAKIISAGASVLTFVFFGGF